MKTEIVETYAVDGNSQATLLSETTVEIQGPTIEEKEAELLKVYAELEALKEANK